jgi:CheY-like chemotaxis protein
MAKWPSWQDEILRQKERLATDRPSRQIGVAMSFVLFGFYLPFWMVFFAYLLNIGSEVLQQKLLDDFEAQPTRRLQFAIIANSALGLAVYSVPAVLVLMSDDPMMEFLAVLALVGALLNVSVVRSIHLPLGIFTGIPPALALLWVPLSASINHQNTSSAILATVGVTVLVGYFISSLLQNYRAQTELVRAIENANAASDAKSRFLSAMSHEIRTPLNTVLGFSQIMRDTPERAATPQNIDRVEEAAHTLKTLIEDVLDLASASAGGVRFNLVTAAFRQELATALVPAGRSTQNLRTVTNIEDDVPELGRFDPLLLRKCLSHLSTLVLDSQNEPNTGTLGLHGALLPGTPNWLRLTVTAGEPHAKLDGGVAESTDPDDEGLSLTLVHRLADVMGAKAAILMSPDGCHYAQLDLPFIQVADPPANGVEQVYGRLRVLVVDDIATNRFVVRQILQALRIDVAEADSGPEALEWLRAEPFDLVLLDMNMPEVDGETTFQSIRSSGTEWANTPVIALTADAIADQRTRYLELGLDGYLAKPVDKRLLWAEILHVSPPPPPL